MTDVVIIGAGVIGAAAAWELSRRKVSVTVLERENDVAMGASRANSAIIHAGFDPMPGTEMARLNVEGCAMTEDICRDLDVPYRKVGSYVLAFSPEEDETVRKLYDRGCRNGVPGLEILTGEQVRGREAQVSGEVTSALWAPTAGIINPWEYTLAFAEVAARNGVEFRLNQKVTDIERNGDGFLVKTETDTFSARMVINAAGVHSAEIHDMAAPPAFRMLPSKGQYYLMDKAEGTRAGAVLFQCPSKVGKGVLVAPTVHGNLIVGPDAEPSDDPDRVNTTGTGLEFVRTMASKSVPTINFRNSIRNFAGMRANTDKDDFIIGCPAPGFVDLAGIKSPGLSSAPAIAREAVRLLQEQGMELPEKETYVKTRHKTRFAELNQEEKQEAIRNNPLYGRVICRCETITEGEIVDAIHSPIPPVSIDGIKRRCNAGMGRCQGGFCGPRVLEILARETNCSPLDVLKDKNGSRVLVSETKEGEL